MILKFFAVALMAFVALIMVGMVIAALIAFRRWLPVFIKKPKRIFLDFVEDNWKGAAFLLAYFVAVPYVWLPLCRQIADVNERTIVFAGVPFVVFLLWVRSYQYISRRAPRWMSGGRQVTQSTGSVDGRAQSVSDRETDTERP
jgi:hypothetical protein